MFCHLYVKHLVCLFYMEGAARLHWENLPALHGKTPIPSVTHQVQWPHSDYRQCSDIDSAARWYDYMFEHMCSYCVVTTSSVGVSRGVSSHCVVTVASRYWWTRRFAVHSFSSHDKRLERLQISRWSRNAVTIIQTPVFTVVILPKYHGLMHAVKIVNWQWIKPCNF